MITEEPCEGYSQMLKDIAQAIGDHRPPFKKSDFYQDKASSWLADEFYIKCVRYSNIIEPGVKIITPYEDFISVQFCALDDKKYNVVILWIGGEGPGIQLF